MPHFAPVWMSDCTRNVLLSRISAEMDGVLTMISKDGDVPRLVNTCGSSNCEMTAWSTVES